MANFGSNSAKRGVVFQSSVIGATRFGLPVNRIEHREHQLIQFSTANLGLNLRSVGMCKRIMRIISLVTVHALMRVAT